MLGLQFSIIVFQYNAESTTTEKQILENKCSELQCYDQTDYYTQHNHYQTFRKCEITCNKTGSYLSRVYGAEVLVNCRLYLQDRARVLSTSVSHEFLRFSK